MCQNDTDCPLGLVCYEGTERWAVDSKYEEMYGEGEPFCECSGFYGWTGDRCDEIGYAWISASFFIVGLIVLCVALAFASREFVFRVRAQTKFELNAALTTTILILLSAVLYILQSAFRLCIYFQPTENDRLDPSGEGEEKFGACAIEERIVLPLASAFAITSAFNISLLWMEVADRARSMKGHQSNNLKRYRKPVIIMQSLFFFIVFISLIVGYPVVASASAVPFIIAVVVSYFLGAHRLTSLLGGSTGASSNQPSTNKRTMQTVLLIRQTALAVGILLTIALIFLLTYTYVTFTGWREFSPPRQASIADISNTMTFFLMFCVLFILSRYLSKTGSRRRTAGMVGAGGQVSATGSSQNNANDSNNANTATTGNKHVSGLKNQASVSLRSGE